jgi:ABC-type Fe3+/spermidine/putrescine transport system ATPase subunit
MSLALRLHGLEVPFGQAAGLSGISLRMRPGERLVLVGPSGAGKTTLLRAIAGLAPASGGTLEIAGRDVTRLPAERRGAVYLHQTPLLFPHLSVGANIAFPLRIRGVRRCERVRRVGELLEAIGLAGFENRMPRTLSGGQRHRVALARAIAARPALLLLDEPFAALDPRLREEVREATLDAQQQFVLSLVIVTHDLDEAGLLGDRVGVLLDGRLAQLAPPAELFARPATAEVARFVGFRNQVNGTMGADGVFRSALGSVYLNGRSPRPGPVTALFRPTAVRAAACAARGARVVGHRQRVEGATLLVEVGGARLEIAADPTARPREGEAVGLTVDACRLLLFAEDSAGS